MRLAGYSGLLLVTVVAVLVLVWLLQRRLIYFPLDPRLPRAAEVLPGAEDVSFTTEDGLRLGGWFVPPAGASAGAAVLVFNGNAGSRADRASLAAGLSRRGFSVLLFDYRGYGGNAGSPSEIGLLRDARAARDYLEGRPGIGTERIVYFGESLGAAVAVALAHERPPVALALRSPFTSLVDVGRFHYPFLPVRWILRDRFPSIEKISRLGGPLLVLAGDEDRIVPFAQSRELFEAATSAEPRSFIALEGADHNDPELTSGSRMLDDFAGFLMEAGVVPGKRPTGVEEIR